MTKTHVQPLPWVGSHWRGVKGEPYRVLLIANQYMRSRHYPVIIVFMDNSGTVLALPASKWKGLVRTSKLTYAPNAFIEGLPQFSDESVIAPQPQEEDNADTQ